MREICGASKAKGVLTAFTPQVTSVPPILIRAEPSAVDTEPGGAGMGEVARRVCSLFSSGFSIEY